MINILKTRRSIRKYSEKQILDSELDAILEAGTYAPTGMNKQTPIIVAVQDKALIEKLEIENAKVLGNPDAKPFYGAPTVVIVFADGEARTGFEDACLVMGNLMNAAASIGVGSCWIHRAKEVFQTDLGKELKSKWGIDDRFYGVGNCILGYPAEIPEAKPRKENYIIKA